MEDFNKKTVDIGETENNFNAKSDESETVNNEKTDESETVNNEKTDAANEKPNGIIVDKLDALTGDACEHVQDEILFSSKSHFGEREAFALADYQSRRLSALFFFSLFAVCVLMSLYDGFLKGDVIYGVTILVVAAIVFPLLYIFIKKMLRKSVVKNNAYYGCDCIISVDCDTVYERVIMGGEEVSKSSYPVANIVKVADYKEFLFVFISKVQVVIVDKYKFEKGTAEDFKAFVATKKGGR